MWLLKLQVALLIIAAICNDVTGKPPQKILRGLTSGEGELPYQIYLNYNEENFCGGCIISSKHILTAAHCVFDLKEPHQYDKLYVYSGIYDLKIGGELHKVKSIKVHPKYVHNAKRITENDIAVLILEEPIIFNHLQSPIGLPTRDDYSGSIGIVSGWGNLNPDRERGFYPFILNKLETMIFNLEECSKDNQICTYTEDASTCNGDSGGPLVVGNELVGILSGGPKMCDEPDYDVYTKVYSFLDFIKKIMENENEIPVITEQRKCPQYDIFMKEDGVIID